MYSTPGYSIFRPRGGGGGAKGAAVWVVRGRWSGSGLATGWLGNNTSIIAEKGKPRLNPQKICQNMVKDSHSAGPTATTMFMMISLNAAGSSGYPCPLEST